jgi:hypothetical protein
MAVLVRYCQDAHLFRIAWSADQDHRQRVQLRLPDYKTSSQHHPAIWVSAVGLRRRDHGTVFADMTHFRTDQGIRKAGVNGD